MSSWSRCKAANITFLDIRVLLVGPTLVKIECCRMSSQVSACEVFESLEAFQTRACMACVALGDMMSPARRTTLSNSRGTPSSTPGFSLLVAVLQRLVYVTMAFSSQVLTCSLLMTASRSGRRRVLINCSRVLSAVSKLTLLTLLIECSSLCPQSVHHLRGSLLALSLEN